MQRTTIKLWMELGGLFSIFTHVMLRDHIQGALVACVNTGGHSIRVFNNRSVSDDGNLCPLWPVILKLV